MNYVLIIAHSKPTRIANNTFLQSKPVIWYISKCMQDNLST